MDKTAKIKKPLNIQIRDLPIEVDKDFERIALSRGVRKWELLRDAIIEFVAHHKVEIKDETFDIRGK